MSILNQLYEDLKVIFLTETKCKIRFIDVGFNCKRKKWGKKRDGNHVHSKGREGGPTLNGKFHFKFQFCFLNPSVIKIAGVSPSI